MRIEDVLLNLGLTMINPNTNFNYENSHVRKTRDNLNKLEDLNYIASRKKSSEVIYNNNVPSVLYK